MTTTDYPRLKAEIEQWLVAHQVTSSIQFIGDECPPYCPDKGKDGIGTFPRHTHIHGQHYRLTLKRAKISLSVDYWNSYHDAELRSYGGFNRQLQKLVSRAPKVRVADILSCAEFNNPGPFDEFCAEFGYDSDSRKAESVWKAVIEQAADFHRMFTQAELDELSEKVREL